MKAKSIIKAAALCLLLAQDVAAEKTAGPVTVLGDGLEFTAGSVGQIGAGGYVLDGALGGVAYGASVNGATELESGFYSRMVASPLADFYNAGSSSYTLTLTAANPPGTTYDVFVSTWDMADPYMAYYSTDASGRPIENLYPNTSFYNFVLANYMDGDYSAFSATAAVTLAAAVSSSTFRFEDLGHNTLNMSFSAFSNPAAAEAGSWTTTAALPFSRYGAASVVYGTHVFVSGGFTGVYPSSAVYRAEFNQSSGLGAWKLTAFMPEALYGHQLVAARGRLYVLGGRSQTAARSAVWSADISATGQLGPWEAEAPMSAALYFHAAAAAGDEIYVSGGYGAGVSAAIRYAAVSGTGALTWNDASVNLPGPRYAHGMTILAGRLCVTGGNDGASARSEVWTWLMSGAGALTDPDTKALPAPRYGHTALPAANALYVIGGHNGSAAMSTVFFSTLAASAANSGPWLAQVPLGAARQFAAGAAWGGKFYLFGGSDGGNTANTVYTADMSATRYMVEISSDSLFAVDRRNSGWMGGYGWSFGGLSPGTTYYTRVKAVNRLGVETPYSKSAYAVTYAAIPGTAAWTNVAVSSATLNWLANGNPDGTEYELEYSSQSNYSLSNIGSVIALSSSTGEGVLQANTTYYARVRVLASPGGESRFIDLPTVFTSFDPAMDTSSPTVAVVMPPVITWRSTNTFLCNLDFSDNLATDSGLDYFQVRSSTTSGDAAGAWGPASTINQRLYTQDWTVPWGVWDGMLEAASNYISVRVVDAVGNTTDYIDAFSVLKDTTPPLIISTYIAYSGPWTVDPGPVHSLEFSDALSGLYKAQYSVSTNDAFPDASVIGWTNINTPALTPGDTYYAPVINYNFAQLANAPSNYFTLRAVDVAGSTYTLLNAFSIGKNVSGPTVAITDPAAAPPSLSTFTYLAGTTAMTNGQPVLGTEVSLLDNTGGKYYNGSAFNAASRVWFDADDNIALNTFSYTFAGLPLVSGREYKAVARSSDALGDYSQLFATRTFIYDTQPPDAQVLNPANGETYSGSLFLGSAADASGLSAVSIALKRLSNDTWWNNGAWAAPVMAITVVSAQEWTYTFPDYLRDNLAHGASYYVTVRAADLALPANQGSFGVSGTTFTYIDTIAPPQTAVVLAADGGQRGAVRLTWQTVGDNGATGFLTAGTYRVAYSTYAGAAVSTATPSGVSISTANLVAGATQVKLITGLNPGDSYYFTLWTADDALNWSPASTEVLGVASIFNSGGVTGNVSDASPQAITGVLVEALGTSGALEGSDYTDAFGNYSITGLTSEIISVRAVLPVQDIESSVSKDSIPNGASGVNFRLSAVYQLAGISGFIPAGFMPQRYTAPAGPRYTTREVRPAANQPFVEIYRKGRRIGTVFVDGNGAFEVGNLLPATYGVRVYNGTDFSKMELVTLRPGQIFMFTPKFDLLNKDSVFAYPNPANTEVNFRFIPVAAGDYEARVDVFDIAGRLVKTLKTHDGILGGGVRRFNWNITRENVASGVYVYILRVKDASGAAKPVIKKFAVIR